MTGKEDLKEIFERLRQAFLSNDWQVLEELIAEDYTGFGPGGTEQDKSMTLEAYRPGGVRLDIYETAGVDIRIFGDVGIITGTGYLKGTYGEAQFEDNLRFVDLYILRNGRWMLLLSQVTPVK